jgi:hypothetical protein
VKLRNQIIRASIEHWAKDHGELAHVAKTLGRSIDKPKPEIPALRTEEMIRVIASAFRLADRLHSDLLRGFWLTVACEVYERDIHPRLDYMSRFSREDGLPQKSRRQRNTSTAPALQPRSYSEGAQEGFELGNA